MADALKEEGNTFFQAKQYQKAIDKYVEATEIDDNIPALWSNIAACYEKLKEFEKMAEAGRSCIKADKDFVKGYFRLATALKQLNRLEECAQILESGLEVEPSNSVLLKMQQDVQEIHRVDQVQAYIVKAKEQIKVDDVTAALETLELAADLDPGNRKITALKDEIQADQHTLHKREFDRIIKHYQLDTDTKSEEIAQFLTSRGDANGGSVSALEFAEKFGTTNEEAVVFLEWIKVGVKFKAEAIDVANKSGFAAKR